MANSVQIAQRVKPETVKMIRELAELTMRGQGDVIDWAVYMAYQTTKGLATFAILPHPADAPAVQLMTVCPHPPEAQQEPENV